MKKKYFFIGTIFLSVLFVFSMATSSDRDYWPTKEWRTSSPEDQGMDSVKLENLNNFIQEELWMTTSILIVRHGYIVFEQYNMGDKESLRTLWSVTKSVTSALIGISIREGYLESIDQKVSEFFPEYISKDMNPKVNQVTIRHLLTLSSGLAHNRDDATVNKETFNRPLRKEPGEEFSYNEVDPNILSMIITKTSRLKALDLGIKYLFEPLGISTVEWSIETSAEVIYNIGGYGLQLTSRDAAKIGYLYLNKGMWDNQQIIPSEWVLESTREQIRLPEYEAFMDDYGFLWWVRSIDGHHSYTAVGFGGQYVYVIPDLDMVIVITTLGAEDDAPLYLQIIDKYVIPSVTN